MKKHEWQETLDSIVTQLHELDIKTNKQFKHWLNQNPAAAQLLIRVLMETLVYLSRPIEDLEEI